MGKLLPSSLLLDVPSTFQPSFRSFHQLVSIQAHIEGLSSLQFRIALCYLLLIRSVHLYLLDTWKHSTVVFEGEVKILRLQCIADNWSLQCMSRRVRRRFRTYMDFMRDSFPNKHSTFVIFSRGYSHSIDITKCSIVQSFQCFNVNKQSANASKVHVYSCFSESEESLEGSDRSNMLIIFSQSAASNPVGFAW